MADFSPIEGMSGNVEDRRDGKGKAGRGPQHPDWYRYQPNQMTIPSRGPLADMLDAVYNQLSRRLAGGDRQNVNDLLPGAQDPFEGIIPDEYRPDLEMYDWFEPSIWMYTQNNDIPGVDFSGFAPASGAGTDGDGGDWFRGSEAPNNYVNRHNPLYAARRDFAMNVAPKIEQMFGVNGGGVGYLRPPKASDAAAGGRSSNSDHYSGGAVDFYGSVDQLDRLRDWLTEQPFTSFVRWRSESHGGHSGTESGAHLHVSFDIGWVAQNWFKGRTLPDMRAAAVAPQAAVSSPTLPDSPDTSLGATAVAPEIVRGRPS